MQHQRRAGRRQRLEVLARRHRGRQRRDPRQRHGLRDAWHRQLASEHGRCRRESRYTRDDFVVHAERVEAAALFGQRAVERRVAGVQSRDVVPGGVGVGEFTDDLVERQRPGVDDPGIRRAQRQQVVGHDRARVQAHRAAAQQPLAAHGDQIGGARARRR